MSCRHSRNCFRYNDKELDMGKTMEENGILDERDRFGDLGLPQNFYVPCVFIYYNDDFKWEDSDPPEERRKIIPC